MAEPQKREHSQNVKQSNTLLVQGAGVHWPTYWIELGIEFSS